MIKYINKGGINTSLPDLLSPLLNGEFSLYLQGLTLKGSHLYQFSLQASIFYL